MAASEGVHKERKSWLEGAVPGEAKLQDDSQEHVNSIRLDPVALQGQEHPLPPRRVKPRVYPHVVAYEHGMQSDARITPLKKVAQLQVV